MADVVAANEVENLIQSGEMALLAGDAHEARKVFRRVVELQPENIEGWVGLAESILPYKDKYDYLQRALSLDPSNVEIRAKFDLVQQKIAAGEVFAPPHRAKLVAKPSSLELPETASAVPKTYCYRHPDRETGLHCTQCNQPICAECTLPALVGQLCPDCTRERRPPNYQVSTGDLVIAGLISLVGSILLSFLVVFFVAGFFIILSFFIAPIIAGFIVRLLDRATRAKRGKAMQITVALCIVVGAAPLLVLTQSLGLLLFTIVLIGSTGAQLR